MSVEIDPVELGFHRPFTTEVSQVLKIRNPNHTPVAFKVKTTAPKQYCVRPNSGRIEPGKEVEVTVLLQAMKQTPAPDAKCRDKFLVQSVAVTADKEFTNIASIWQHVDDAERSSVQEKKIRVVYLPQQGTEKSAASTSKNGSYGVDGPNLTPTPPPMYTVGRSPSPEAFTPNIRSSSGAFSSGYEAESSKKAQPAADAQGSSSSFSSPLPASLATAARDSAPSYEELEAKLAEAQATIANYTQEGGLRLRKAAQGETGNKAIDNTVQQVQAQVSQGVPLQLAAALCLFSFLLAYLFF